MAPLIRARATVNLEQFPVGSEADVDPDDPRTAALLRTGLLVSDEWGDEPPPTVREPRKPNTPREPEGAAAETPTEETPPDDDPQPETQPEAASPGA